MQLYKIEKMDFSKIDKETLGKALEREAFSEVLVTSAYPEYLYWDKFKYKKLPEGTPAEVWWAAVKLFRDAIPRSKGPAKTEDGNVFSWLRFMPGLDEFLHIIDIKLGGSIIGNAKDLSEYKKGQLIIRGVMDESIASSQLEGAVTTRKVAKQMLREKRKPKTTSEQMILNNYETMLFVENEAKDRKLDENLLLTLHSMLTTKTLEKESDAGKLRDISDEIEVRDHYNEWIYHVAPNIDFAKTELDKLYDFANDELDLGGFIHPVIKAIVLHFWIGYLHPFVDGNGRLARIIFYWYLLRKGYWQISFLPLSKGIKSAAAQYKMAYVYSEQDNFDLTYFIDFNVRKLKVALDEFEKYLKKEQAESSLVSKVLVGKYNLNERQIRLVRYLQSNKNEQVTIKNHMVVNNITRITAVKDLEGLTKLGFVIKNRSGKKNVYYAGNEIEKLL